MTTLDIEFYCLIVVAIGAVLMVIDNRRLRRKLRVAERCCEIACEDAVAERALSARFREEADRQKLRAVSAIESSKHTARRLQDAHDKIYALKHPPRGDRGRFVSRAPAPTAAE